MLAGRPHEAAGNGSPRWMTAGPRERAHRTRPTGRLTPSMVLTCGGEVSSGSPGHSEGTCATTTRPSARSPGHFLFLQPDELVARWLRIVALFCHVRQGMCWSVQVLPSGSVQAIRALTVAIRSARAERTQANGQARP